MFSAIERESGERLRTQFFPNGVLGSDVDMMAQLRVGALQFYFQSTGNITSVVPSADIPNLGFTFDDNTGFRIGDQPLGAYIRQDMESKGIHGCRTFWNGGMAVVGSNPHPIHVPDDFRSFKIRVPNSKILIDLFKTFGASPIPLGLGDLYTGLQTKIVDGENAVLPVIVTSKLYEVNKYISLTNHAWAGLWLMANGDLWKQFPADLAQIVERNNTKYAALARQDMRTGDAALLTELSRHGVAVNRVDPTPFQKVMRPYYEAWAAVFGPTAWGLLENSLGRKLL